MEQNLESRMFSINRSFSILQKYSREFEKLLRDMVNQGSRLLPPEALLRRSTLFEDELLALMKPTVKQKVPEKITLTEESLNDRK
jgi:hypothetical protein